MRKIHIILAVLICCIGGYLGYSVYHVQKEKTQIRQKEEQVKIEQKKEIASYQTPEMQDDFSSYALEYIDKKNQVCIPDNRIAVKPKFCSIKTHHAEFTIPGAWKNNVEISVKQFDQPKENGIAGRKGITRITFTLLYPDEEKDKQKDNEGRLAILYLYSSADNLKSFSELGKDTNLISIGTVGKDKNSSYNIYIYQPEQDDYPTTPEAYRRYMYLENINWIGCIVSSLSVNGSKPVFSNAYVMEKYGKNFNQKGKGIPEDADIPEYYTAPEVLSDISDNITDLGADEPDKTITTYSWPDSYSSPYQYIDHGSSFDYTDGTSYSAAQRKSEEEKALQESQKAAEEQQNSAAETPQNAAPAVPNSAADSNAANVPSNNNASQEQENNMPSQNSGVDPSIPADGGNQIENDTQKSYEFEGVTP